MGRIKIHKQNTKAQIHSVQSKSLFIWLVNQTQHRFGVASEEAKLIAEKAEYLMSHQWKLLTGNRFFYPLSVGKENHLKRARSEHKQQNTCLTAFAYEDLEIHLNLGLKAMQNSRIFRLIEESYAQNTLPSARDLCLLTHTTAKSIRERLIPLWNQGIRLPVQGMARKYRNFHQFRSTYALEHYFSGTSIHELQSFLSFSDALWHRWQRDFLQVLGYLQQSEQPGHISSLTGIPLETISEYSNLLQQVQGLSSFESFSTAYQECAVSSSFASETTDPDTQFIDDLELNHNFSKAKSRMYLKMLSEFREQFMQSERNSETVLYYAAAADECAGKSLDECRLLPVRLSWWSEDDQKINNLNSTEQLKWLKIVRFTTEARHQGACLNQADLAYLLAIHVGVIQQMTQKHDNILLPTRGNVVDMGPGLTHVEQIVELYLQGYTETEIVRRTGHTYGSLENYIMMFSRVVSLLERKMPIPLIRQTIGCSMKLVEKHTALYHKYNTPDYQFMLMQVKRIFESHHVKKNETQAFKRRSIWPVQKKE
ncbi:DUF1670 domain-containing protein [Candidatus Bathyarchaeota archaeon]|nr:DUF1670 domain-containing protein [Candidatus Bathyarchaeota archaeon]